MTGTFKKSFRSQRSHSFNPYKVIKLKSGHKTVLVPHTGNVYVIHSSHSAA